MGGCVVSVMDKRSSFSEVPHPQFQARRSYGVMTEPMGPPSADATCAYRVSHSTDAEHASLSASWYRGENVMQRLQKVCAERGGQRAMAYRRILRTETKTTTDASGRERKWECVHLDAPQYVTYGEVWSRAVAFGCGLRELGVPPGSRVALYEETRWEWFVSMLGMWTRGIVPTTVYANLGLDALAYALKEAECQAIVCNGKQVASLLEVIARCGAGHATIVYLDELPAEVDTQGFRVVPWSAVLEQGGGSAEVAEVAQEVDSDDLALIMYTSGTTGDPKGVMHSFGSLTSGAYALSRRLDELVGPFEEGETYCCYLPLAHILEFICEVLLLLRGTLLCYGSPRTLTDAFATPCGDLTAFKPFFFVGVPRIFETIRKGVEAKLPPPGSLQRRVFDHAYQSRLHALRRGMDTPYWNEKVFKAPHLVFGGRLRAIVCGGAPLGPTTQEFINVVFNIPLAQGYGLTETVCNGTIQRTGELDPVLGQLLSTVEMKLQDTAEYKHTDTPLPRGEILLRGPFLFRGYYKQPELTAEAIDAEGWFHTGDVAEMMEDGTLRIIGRVKALAKNVLGEYIAMENLEALYVQNPLCVPNGVCVLVHPQRPYIAALVLTDAAKAAAFAKEHGLSGSLPELLDNPAFHAKAAQSLAATATAAQRKPFECVKFVRVLADEWTPEGGMVTPSLKLKRRVLEEKYADVIAKLFETE